MFGVCQTFPEYGEIQFTYFPETVWEKCTGRNILQILGLVLKSRTKFRIVDMSMSMYMSMEYLLAEAWAWDIDSMYVRICYSGIPRDFCMWVILFFKQKYFCPTLILWSMRLKLKNLTSRIILFVKLECTCGIYIFQSYQTKCFCDDSQSAHHESEGCLQENNRQLVGQPKEMRV